MAENNVILQVQDVTMQFGGLRAIPTTSASVLTRRRSLAFIGPNGAGKNDPVLTSLPPTINPPAAASPLAGTSLKGLKPNQVVNAGIARTFQNIRLFDSMTVLENVMVRTRPRQPLFAAGGGPAYWSLLSGQSGRRKPKRWPSWRDIGIAHFAHMQATNLGHGNQRKVEIARALATAPKLLLLDEPAAGMNPKETEDLAELIFRMRHDYQLSVPLIEHDMPFVNRLCERVMVLEYGKPLFSGLMAEAIQHPDVISAYLGEAIMLNARELKVFLRRDPGV
ncbi:ABC transporter ATP-binding protein [Klebsiella pneumoniae subsp. pneumoniae]|nr:ABC transporter ATP-binding protein [Klebsiella pneumoniae subsp. pneumoniae]